MATTFTNLTEAWQQIATAATTVQVVSGNILLQTQAAMPASTDTRGHVFGPRELPGVGWGAATAGEKLFARALQGTASIVLSPDIG